MWFKMSYLLVWSVTTAVCCKRRSFGSFIFLFLPIYGRWVRSLFSFFCILLNNLFTFLIKRNNIIILIEIVSYWLLNLDFLLFIFNLRHIFCLSLDIEFMFFKIFVYNLYILWLVCVVILMIALLNFSNSLLRQNVLNFLRVPCQKIEHWRLNLSLNDTERLSFINLVIR